MLSRVGALLIVRTHPLIYIGLQLIQRGVQLAPEGTGIKLILDGLMKPLADAIGLWTLCLGSRVVNPFEIQVQRKLMVLAVAARTQ